jgi:phosphatidylserine synthase
MITPHKTHPWAYIGAGGTASFLALIIGWIGIICVIEHHPYHAIICAIVSFYFDMLDGHIARKRGEDGTFGKHLDSQVDGIVYSVFSSLLLYTELAPNSMGIYLGAIILITGTFRLARLSTEGILHIPDGAHYEGVVVCVVSAVVIVLVLIKPFVSSYISFLALSTVLPLALLQMSRIPFKKKRYSLWIGLSGMMAVGALIHILSL